MRTDIRSTRTNARLVLPLAGALMAIALVTPAQTAPEPPYTVTDVGANYRVWQRTVQLTNSATGEVTQQVQGYTDLEDGMNYLSNGVWTSAQDLIELTPTGAQAVHGQMTAKFSSDIASVGAITLATAAGEVFQSHPLGLFYADSASGKVAQIGRVQESQGLLYAPNVIVFTNILAGVEADLMLVWARNGFEQNLVLKECPPPPETFGLSSASCRLQMWTAMDKCPELVEDRPALLGSGLWDHILIFPDCWFPIGSAYEFGSASLPNPGEAATVRPLSPSDTGVFPTAKSLVTIAGQKVLVEEINYSDLLSALKALGHASLRPSNPNAVEFAARGQLLLPPHVTRQDRPILAAAGPYRARSITFDYIQLSGSTSYYTFGSGVTYYLPSTYNVWSMAIFQNNTCLKFGSNACLIAWGAVSFPSSGAPVVFTSKDDNAYGATITNSTASPNYAASRALWFYYNPQTVTAQNALFRWSQYAMECDQNPSTNNAAIYSSSFQNCQTGVYVNMPYNTLYLSGDTYCNVSRPVYVNGGSPVSGSMTADCGVVSVALVNDPTQDLIGTDTNKNSESECAFILANNSSTIVAAFDNTHLDEVGYGGISFSNIVTPRSTWWARSTNGGLSFTNTQPLPPTNNLIGGNVIVGQGDAPNPAMTYDPNYPSNSSGTVYLLGNSSREPGNTGLRLWTSTNAGQSFTLISTNLPGGSSPPPGCDRPMIKADPSTHYLYVAATSNFNSVTNGVGLFVARSTNYGTNWDLYKTFDISGGQTDIAIKPNGPVYVFWLTGTRNWPDQYTNRLRYAWLMPGSTNWSGPNDVGITLNCSGGGGDRQALRFNGDSPYDWFLVIPFPRAVYVNNHIYLAYSDLPSTNQSTTDQGDIFLAELAATNSNGSLTLTMPPRVVNNDHTQTDQWDAAIAVNPQGTELFIGYYSRQEDATSNCLIKAYGAKVYNIVNGLTNATIDCFPISPMAFPPLFNGTNDPTNLQFDPVYSPGYIPDYPLDQHLCFDQFARVQTNAFDCPTGTVYVNGPAYFFQDDNTWADADTNYFYYAWCDRSRTWTWTALGVTNTRPDADVKFAKIRQ